MCHLIFLQNAATKKIPKTLNFRDFREAQTGFEPVNQGVADQQKNPRNPLKLWGILNVSTLFPPYSTKFKPSSRAN